METEKEAKCANCKHWQPGKTKDEVRRLKLAVCRLLPKWEYLPPHANCKRHVMAAAGAVAARLKWLG